MDIFNHNKKTVVENPLRKKLNQWSLVIAFMLMFAFLLLAASIVYLIASLLPNFYDIMKWIAFGLLMLSIANLIVVLILLIIKIAKKKKSLKWLFFTLFMFSVIIKYKEKGIIW